MTTIHPVYQSQLTPQEFESLYAFSLQNPEEFWSSQANESIHWFQSWDKVFSGTFTEGNIRWFEGGKLNASYNCLDRHLLKRSKQNAIIWQGDEPHETRHITYEALYTDVVKLSNGLLNLGIQKGDRVCIYLPMIPETVVAMLACARIGAIHSVVFGGFSANALKIRIQDANARLLITADEGRRGGKTIFLKLNADTALLDCPSVEKLIVIKRTGQSINWLPKRDLWYHELLKDSPTNCPPAIMDAEDPLFILYTSGSTGTPKGLVHTTAGYLVYVASTFKYVFNPQEGDVYWCTADLGWITGHSYLVYAPLMLGCTSFMFEGTPTYPTPARFWETIDQHQVNILYTSPTILRTLMREGNQFVEKKHLHSLKLLGTVGEPINPEVWLWYFKIIGKERCPIVDTWWQTETGGILISPIPGATALKPGSATLPLFSIEPVIENNQNNFQNSDHQEGSLLIAHPWPGIARTIWGNHSRYLETYLKPFPGYYSTGDGAKCDADGYYWITGRIDDVINVSGHRLGTAEIESALVKHQSVAEAAVVGYPHSIKGQGIIAFVTPMQDFIPNPQLEKELISHIRQEIGSIAIPDKLIWVADLPKTRSGKIMRRILRQISKHDLENLGDLSTLANPDTVEQIIKTTSRDDPIE